MDMNMLAYPACRSVNARGIPQHYWVIASHAVHLYCGEHSTQFSKGGAKATAAAQCSNPAHQYVQHSWSTVGQWTQTRQSLQLPLKQVYEAPCLSPSYPPTTTTHTHTRALNTISEWCCWSAASTPAPPMLQPADATQALSFSECHNVWIAPNERSKISNKVILKEWHGYYH